MINMCQWRSNGVINDGVKHLEGSSINGSNDSQYQRSDRRKYSMSGIEMASA